MKSYDRMEDSGVAWLGKIPNGWKLKRAKHLFAKIQDKPLEHDGVVTAFRNGEVILRSERREEGFTFAIKEIGYQHVTKGDLVIHAMDAFAGAIGVSKSDGKMSPVCSICRPIDPREADAQYYAFLLREMTQRGYLISIAKGIRERSTDFRFKDFSELWLPIPPLDVQRKIVNYIKSETSKIEELIAEQEHLLHLLEEKFSANITRAVTQGLDQNIELKETNVPWLGKIPHNWTKTRLGYYVTHVGSGITPKGGANTYVDYGIKFLRSQNVHNDGISMENMSYIAESVHEDMSRSKLIDKDVLLNITGGSIGRCTVVPVNFGEANVNQHVCAIRCAPKRLDPYFLCYAIQSNMIQSQIFGLQIGSNREGLNYEQIRNLDIAIPDFTLQREIVKILDAERELTKITKQKIQFQTALLRERRASIISHVITGKVKV